MRIATRSRRSWLATLVMATLAGTAALGCSDTRLDTRNIAAAIADQHRAEGGEVEEVVCPQWVRTRVGDTFECRLILEGGREQVVIVEQTDIMKIKWTLASDPSDAPASR